MAKGDYKEVDPLDKKWIITEFKIETIKKNLGKLAYDTVAPTFEALEKLEPLRNYLKSFPQEDSKQ